MIVLGAPDMLDEFFLADLEMLERILSSFTHVTEPIYSAPLVLSRLWSLPIKAENFILHGISQDLANL